MRGHADQAMAGLVPTGRPELSRLTNALLEAWPQHARFLRGSFTGYGAADLVALEDLARRIVILAGDDLPDYLSNYRWMCAELSKEALFFKKHGRYRLATFEAAEAEVYANAPFMRRYMQGLLISQVLWRNHSSAFLHFQQDFLPSLPPAFRYLEVGPGHGLFLSVAAEAAACGHAEAWDVSEESLRQTGEALARLGVRRSVALRRHDVLAEQPEVPSEARFDAIVISEVLEHLERPKEALVALKRHLRPDGRIFINVPINSPAPDHIYLLADVAAARTLVESAGLEVASLRAAPLTGYSLAQAEREKATISCLMVAQ
ncbi:MAG TPA: class I SAM-dependent methyltransferase [Caulobacteraceae bacterium]|jgi:2-polyprenyl-3-methyl-5-hydroxy-6-metoxy-1,4-benzoquinol methylase